MHLLQKMMLESVQGGPKKTWRVPGLGYCKVLEIKKKVVVLETKTGEVTIDKKKLEV